MWPTSGATVKWKRCSWEILTTRAGLEEIDRSLETLSDGELDAIIERARQHTGTLGDESVAAVIAEAVRAVEGPASSSAQGARASPVRPRGVARAAREPEDIREALQYAAEAVRERMIPRET